MPGAPLISSSLGIVGLAITGSQTASGNQVFDTTNWTYAAWDMTLSSFTGGTNPTINFFLERQGADTNWYQIGTTGALNSAPQTISVDISPALNGSIAGPLTSTVQHNVFTQTARLRWVFGGGANATSIAFSASIIGR